MSTISPAFTLESPPLTTISPPPFCQIPGLAVTTTINTLQAETCGICNGVEVSLMNFSLEMGRCFHAVGSRENILEFSKGLTIHLTRHLFLSF